MKSAATILLMATVMVCTHAAPAPAETDENAEIKKYRPPIMPVDDNSVGNGPAYGPAYGPSAFNPSPYDPPFFGGAAAFGGAGFNDAPSDPFAYWTQPHAEPPRRKREVCWFGEKACSLKCKLFTFGAKEGNCRNGWCQCLYPGYYPGYPGWSGFSGQ